MKLQYPKSLSGQTLLVLIFAFALSHIVGLGIYSLDRKEAVAYDEALDIAERAVGVVNLLQKIPLQWREDIVRSSDSRTFRVSLSSGSTVDLRDVKYEFAAGVVRYLQEELSGWSTDAIRIGLEKVPSGERQNAKGRPGFSGNAVTDEPANAETAGREPNSNAGCHLTRPAHAGDAAETPGGVDEGCR